MDLHILSIVWRNTSTQSGLIQQQAHTYAGNSFAEYTFDNASDPRCAAPTPPTSPGGPLQFVIGPLTAGESLRCTWRVSRSPASTNDLEFGLCNSLTTWFLCRQRIYVGSTPDLSLHSSAAESVRQGTVSALVRLTARNLSTHRVASRSVTTECVEFEGDGPFSGPFDIENDFPGACPSSDRRELCSNFTGQNFDSRGFLVGPIEAGGESSCLLRLRLHEPLTKEMAVDVYFFNDDMSLANGGQAFDPARDNNRARLVAAPNGSDAVPLPLAPAAFPLIALMLAVAAARGLRRHGQK